MGFMCHPSPGQLVAYEYIINDIMYHINIIISDIMHYHINIIIYIIDTVIYYKKHDAAHCRSGEGRV